MSSNGLHQVKKKTKSKEIIKQAAPHLPYSIHKFQEDQKDGETIFVSIASYRDPELVDTVRDIFEQADKPGRVFVGVLQQHADEDDEFDCMRSLVAQKFMSNIRVITILASEAKGPTWARHVIESELLGDEMFFLQIDSHTAFVKGWDSVCIQQLLACQSEKAILSTFPDDYTTAIQKHGGRKRVFNEKANPVFVKFYSFHKTIGLPQQEKARFRYCPNDPVPSLFWSANFVFTLAHFVKAVPYDPNLPYLFLGEEISMNMRFWTSGYDIYSPSKHIVFHLFDRSNRALFWENFYKLKGVCKVDDATRLIRKQQETESVERVFEVLRGTIDESDPYGPGKERSVQDFWNHVGLVLDSKKHEKRSALGVLAGAGKTELFAKLGSETMK